MVEIYSNIIKGNTLCLDGGEMNNRTNSEKLNFFSTVRFINQFLNKMHLQLVLFYFGWLFDTLAGIIAPILLGIMINQVVYYQNLPLFIKISLVFLGVSIFSCILYFLLYEMYGFFWNELIFRMRCRMFLVVQRMDAKTMANSNYGDIAQLIQWKVMECVNFIVRNLIHNINNYINIVICLIITLLIDPWIALVLTIMVPVSVYTSWKFGKRIRKEKGRNQEMYGGYIGWLYEIFNALKDIRLLGAENHVNQIFHKHQDVLIETDVKVGIAVLKAENIIAIVNTFIQMILYVVLAFLALYKGLSIGSVTVVLTYFYALTKSLQKVSSNYMDAQNRISVIQRIKELMEQPTVDSRKALGNLNVSEGRIDFVNLSFAYEHKKSVIEQLDLHIDAGEKIAIVGESGCGKTTLSYLLLGFYEPYAGQIKIDGEDISKYSLESIRKNIGVVQQDVLIFDGTIRYNIMLGNENATEKDLIRVCKAAGVYDFVMEMEEKFETVLGRNGRQLSGGQKQRIAIARVYLKNPPIIIFDEATASLDSETENQIHKAWEKMLKGRTAIVIAHRQSSVMLCDKVAVMSEGKIAETGTPGEMKTGSKRFQTLFAIKEECGGV